MLSTERRDRNRPDKLSGLSQCEYPALQTPFGAGLSFRLRGNPSLALRSLRDAILLALAAVSHAHVHELKNLRQPRIATHFRGAHHRREFLRRTLTGNPGVALCALPSQIFFRAPASPRRTSSSVRAKQVARGTKNVTRESPLPSTILRFSSTLAPYPIRACSLFFFLAALLLLL